jgi:hypothetical protein
LTDLTGLGGSGAKKEVDIVGGSSDFSMSNTQENKKEEGFDFKPAAAEQKESFDFNF